MNSSSLSGKLSRGAAGSLIVRIGAVLVAFISNVVLARFLGVSEYGLFVYGMSWLNILLIPATLGFDRLLVRQVAIYHSREEWSKLKGISQFAVSRTLGMSLVIGLLVFGFIAFNKSSQSLAPVFYLVALLIPVGALIRLLQAALQGLQFIALGQLPEFVIQPVLLILSVIMIVYAFRYPVDAAQVMFLNIAAGLVTLLIGIFLIKRSIPVEARMTTGILTDKGNWLPSMIPMMLVGGVFILNDQLAAVMLGFLSNADQVAIYSAAERLSRFTVFMLIVLNPVLGPIFASLNTLQKKEQLQRVVTLSSQIITLFALIPLSVFVIAPNLLLSVFGSEFSGGETPLIILSLGQFINAATGSVGVLLTMVGYERTVVIVAGLGVFINMLLGLLLIPSLTATGAAISASIGAVVTNIVLSIFVFRKIQIIPTALGKLFSKALASL